MFFWIRIIFSFFFLSPCLSYALESSGQDVVSQKLAESLNELKNSVNQLSVSDEDLTLKNRQLKTRLTGLQASLQKLQKENQELSNDQLKLEQNPAGAKRIEQLQKRIKDLDDKTNVLKDQIKKLQENFDNGQKQEKQMDEQMTKWPNASVAVNANGLSPQLSELIEQKQKEKLAALKMISESQSRQELLQEKIQDLQKNPSDKKSNQKEILEAQAAQLQEDIDHLSALANHSSVQAWGEEQFHQLEMSVSNLEKNRDELKDLLSKMQQKTQSVHLTTEQNEEQARFQSSITQLKTQTKDLKFDLIDMQQKMVDLDKRKSYLESLLQK